MPAQIEIVGEVGRPRHPWRTFFITLFALALIVGLGVGTWAYRDYYANRALPHTSLGGVDISGFTEGQVKKVCGKINRAAEVKLTGDVDMTVPATALGTSVDTEATLAQIFPKHRSLRQSLRALVEYQELQPAVKTDDRLAAYAAHSLQTKTPPTVVDPAIVVDEENGTFQVREGQPGRGVDSGDILKAAAAALQNYPQPTTSEIKLKQVQPLPPEESFPHQIELANQLIAPQIRLWDKWRLIQPTRVDKMKWVDFPALGSGQVEPKINPDKVLAWVEAVAEEKVNYFPVMGQRRVTRDGKLLELLRQAQDGTEVSNADTLARGIVAALNKGEGYDGDFETRVVEGKYEDEKTNETLAMPYNPGPKEKWISVDLVHHTVTAYVGKEIVYGPRAVVTGSLPSPTPVGVFHIFDKRPSQTMEGDGWDGHYKVYTPWVQYFYRDYALHGAPWRYHFVYNPYGGSHGCVNLDDEAAKWLYDWADYGTTVVTHK